MPERWFKWFAWHPVDTTDRGWRWLRVVYRRRCFVTSDVPGAPGPWFEHRVKLRN